MKATNTTKSYAIILAAGMGSRLSRLTKHCPKCLVKVNDRAILDYAICGYLDAGLKEQNIFVVVGYKSEMIETFLSQNYPQIRIIKNRDFATTNNMYSLYLALKNLPTDSVGTLFINNGDCLYESQLIKDFADSPLPNAIATQSGIYNEESMKVTLGASNVLINIAKDIPQNETMGISTDLYKFSSHVAIALFNIIKDFIEIKKDLTQWSEVAFPLLFRQVKVYPHDIDSHISDSKGSNGIDSKKWIEVDNEDDLALADRIFSDFDLSAKKALICDMDGTLWIGNRPLSEAIDFINRAHVIKEIFFLTNNTSKIPSDYVDKLASFEIDTDLAHIITPLEPLIAHIKQYDSIYLVANKNITHFIESSVPSVDCSFDLARNKAVILTYDTQITYEKLSCICKILQNKEVPFIATHSDIFCPSELGAMPDIGSFIALIEKVCNKSPNIILGKPNVVLVKSILQRYKPSEIAIIGDRLYTDKALADNIGCDFVLTLTGESTRADLQNYAGTFPALIVQNLGDIDLGNSDSMPRHEREREKVIAQTQIDFAHHFILDFILAA